MTKTLATTDVIATELTKEPLTDKQQPANEDLLGAVNEPVIEPSDTASRDAAEPLTDQEKLEQLQLSQTRLNEIKDNLNKMIDAMAQNPSLFSRASTFWGERPLWLKIVAGILLTIPALVLGIVTNVLLITSISAFLIVTYVGATVVLENHYAHNVANTDNLKTGISSLADTLGTIIQLLGTITTQLAEAIDAFKKENERLEHNVAELNEQINTLTTDVAQLSRTAAQLTETKNRLEETARSLGSHLEEQKELLAQNAQALQQVQQDYEENDSLLKEKIRQVEQLHEETQTELKLQLDISQVLMASTNELSRVRLDTKEDQAKFKQKMEAFLNDKSASFLEISDRIFTAEKELVQTKEELNRLNTAYQELLNRQEKQVDRLEELAKSRSLPQAPGSKTKPDNPPHEHKHKRTTEVSVTATRKGFFGSKKDTQPENPKQAHDSDTSEKHVNFEV